jgi:hypothetical protein
MDMGYDAGIAVLRGADLEWHGSDSTLVLNAGKLKLCTG